MSVDTGLPPGLDSPSGEGYGHSEGNDAGHQQISVAISDDLGLRVVHAPPSLFIDRCTGQVMPDEPGVGLIRGKPMHFAA